ncbi:MAG TPA: pentapeptide repeat-containing protein [Terracidiphilus sp.]
MANPEHVAKLLADIRSWNEWKKENWKVRVDLSGAVLSDADLEDADLHGANLRGVAAQRACMAGAKLDSANLSNANLAEADLTEARLWQADLHGAHLQGAKLVRAELKYADATLANFAEASLNNASLRFAKLSGCDLSGADIRTAQLDNADLTGANLTGASLYRAGLSLADLSGAKLTGADLRAATLLQAKLIRAIANDVKLWESQRSGWKIDGILCRRAFWDRDAQEPTAYEPGEFERLHSEQASIELFYQGGVSKFELNTLPALLHHLAVQHPGTNIRLKSIEETGGGAKISISVGDSDAETVDKIRADAMQVHNAQLALRDNEILRLETEKKYLESFVSERLIKAMLTATTQQNVFNAPVYGVALSSGNSSAVVNQTVNDNSALLALLEKMMQHQHELRLGTAEATSLQAEVESARAELEKPEPSPSMLARSLKFVQKIAGEAATKAAGKLGEQAVSMDWHTMLHQLNQFVQTLK